MSKPVKALLRKELIRRLTGVRSLAVLSLSGVDGVSNNQLRRDLRVKDIHMAVVKNAIVKQAFAELGLDSACELIDGPCALAFADDPGQVEVVAIVRELLDRGKDIPSLTVKGALMEGEVFGADRVEALSRYPTRPEALARLAAVLLTTAGRLAAAILSPGGRLAGAVKSLAEKEEQEPL